jgi:hypothetical protein
MKLYKIAEIGRILKIPEGTAIYYWDRHNHYMDHIGRGRKNAINQRL